MTVSGAGSRPIDRRSMVAAVGGTFLIPGAAAAIGPGADPPLPATFLTLAARGVPVELAIVTSSGFSVPGRGPARYARDAAIGAAYVAANPTTSFITKDGRVFRLVEPTITPQMVGAAGDGKCDDGQAFAAAIGYARTHGCAIRVPAGTYRLTSPLEFSPTHDAFPYHALCIVGEAGGSAVMLLDYDGPYGIRVNDATGTYSVLAGGYVGNLTVTVAPGRYIRQPVRILNAVNSTFENIRIRADWNRMTNDVEMLRISAATQWSQFRNIVIEPFGIPYPIKRDMLRGTGISIGNPYRDVPLLSSAVSNNSFYDCTINQCHIGFLTDAADATTIYSCRVVQSDYNWVDRASWSTVYINPWDEGALERGFTFDAARVTDSTGTNVRKTQYPQIVGGYVGSVRLDGVVGASLRVAMNALDITAAVQRCRVVLIGQDSVTVTGEQNDCLVERYDTTRNAHVSTFGKHPHILRWGTTGAEYHFDETGNPGFGMYSPTRSGEYAGFREEINVAGEHLSYAWSSGAIGAEVRTLVRRVTADRHVFGTPLLPDADNRLDLGVGERAWRNIFLGAGAVVTADARLTQDFSPIPDAWLDVWGKIVWGRFKHVAAIDEKQGAARWHTGLIAQHINDAFAAVGIDAAAIGLTCRSARTETGADAHAERWGVRYDESQAMEAAWQRRELARLTARLDAMQRPSGTVRSVPSHD